jgi:tRNA A-37 threonylcarbamoyl transferase component Bud32
MLNHLLDKFRPAKVSAVPPAPASAGQELPEVTEWRPGETILERYQIDQVFSGAMGKVYIAQHLGWKIPVAIKVPRAEVLADREGAKRIFTEADSWIRMGMHPNVATCFYVRTINKVPHLFIEYVDGGDLSTWLKTGRCKDPRTALSMAIQFCHGMEFTHAKGIIHRDIKPQNILVTKNALVKITDFGIVQSAWHSDPDSSTPLPEDTSLNGTVGFRGTPGYASPEQFRNTHAVDRRTDIFSFGICLWLMFCGKKPFKNNQIPEQAEPSPPAGAAPFPEILTHLLKKSVAYAPENRYQDFKALRADLNQAYIALYRVDCPYMEVDFTDLEAENYNNRAVSYLELGKTREAEQCLARAMEINDSLPEALYNHTLLRWQGGQKTAAYLYRQMEAVRQRLPKAKLLEALALALKNEIQITAQRASPATGGLPQQPPQTSYPEYALCLPKNSSDVFRASQLYLASKRNVLDLLTEGEYQRCHEVLSRTWENIGYRKDKTLLDAYEQLVGNGTKKGIRGVIRLMTLPSVGGPAGWLTLLPGSRRILFLSQSGKVMIRPYGSDQKIKVLDDYQDVTALAVNGSRQLLALATPDKISLLSLQSGTVERTIALPGKARALLFSPDGTLLACGNDTGQILTVDLASNKSWSVSVPKSGPVRALAYFDKRQDFVSGHEDGTICFWERGARECHRQLEAHALPVTILAPSANGSFFISSAADRTIKIWNRRSGQCLKSIKPHEDAINAVMMLPDNTHFISGSDDDLIKIWSLDSGRCQYTLDGRGDGIHCLTMGPQPHIFLTGCNDGSLIAWMVIYDLEFS